MAPLHKTKAIIKKASSSKSLLNLIGTIFKTPASCSVIIYNLAGVTKPATPRLLTTTSQ